MRCMNFFQITFPNAQLSAFESKRAPGKFFMSLAAVCESVHTQDAVCLAAYRKEFSHRHNHRTVT